MADWINVSPVAEFTLGSRQVLEVDDVQVAVFNIDGEFHAIEDVCSHEYALLSDGDLDGCEIECPLHGARFDVRTGEVLSPPAYEPVASLKTRVQDGMVQVMDDRWD